VRLTTAARGAAIRGVGGPTDAADGWLNCFFTLPESPEYESAKRRSFTLDTRVPDPTNAEQLLVS